MRYVFADEAGNFDFSAHGSKYFIVAAVTMPDCAAGADLLELRHALAMEDAEGLEHGFHATEDKQAIRNRVFQIIQNANLEIDAVILDKRKTIPRIAADETHFYKLAWQFLFQHMARVRLPKNERSW